MRRLSSSSASLAISLAALFVALGGTAFAVSQIGTSQIRNGAVTAAKLHSAAVTSDKIKAGAVGSKRLANVLSRAPSSGALRWGRAHSPTTQ